MQMEKKIICDAEHFLPGHKLPQVAGLLCAKVTKIL